MAPKSKRSATIPLSAFTSAATAAQATLDRFIDPAFEAGDDFKAPPTRAGALDDVKAGAFLRGAKQVAADSRITSFRETAMERPASWVDLNAPPPYVAYVSNLATAVQEAAVRASTSSARMS